MPNMKEKKGMVLLEDLLETCELGSIVQCLEVCIYLMQRGCGTVVETLPSAPILPRHLFIRNLLSGDRYPVARRSCIVRSAILKQTRLCKILIHPLRHNVACRIFHLDDTISIDTSLPLEVPVSVALQLLP